MNPRSLFLQISSNGDSVNEFTKILLERELVNKSHHDDTSPILQHHPLGFFCIRWDIDAEKSIRIHIWDKKFEWTQEPNWPIHDHIFLFKSVVLHGTIQNKTYTIGARTPHRCRWTLYEVTYGSQESSMRPIFKNIGVQVSSFSCQQAQSIYELPAGIFHRSTLRSTEAITVLATTTPLDTSQKPRVIGNSRNPPMNFNRKPSNEKATMALIENAISLLSRD